VDGGSGAGAEGRVDLGRLLEHIADDGLSRLEERGEALRVSVTIHYLFKARSQRRTPPLPASQRRGPGWGS
jgi:hypothetical protein